MAYKLSMNIREPGLVSPYSTGPLNMYINLRPVSLMLILCIYIYTYIYIYIYKHIYTQVKSHITEVMTSFLAVWLFDVIRQTTDQEESYETVFILCHWRCLFISGLRFMMVSKIVGYLKRLFELMWLSDVADLNLIELDIKYGRGLHDMRHAMERYFCIGDTL